MTGVGSGLRPSGRIRILLVDDDPQVLRATGRVLSAAGYDVTSCSSGMAAADTLETESFDVAVSDIDMPGCDGIELLKLLRARQKDLPVVLVTGAPALQTAIDAVEFGAFKYLTKPLKNADLEDAIKRAVSSRPSSTAADRARESSASPADQVIASARPPIAAGAVLAQRYRLDRLLGEGGMSQVWGATHLLTTRAVAVKLLRAALNAQPDMRRRLLREARASSSFEHRNVVDVHDIFELEDGTPVMVMALLHGQTLGDGLSAAARFGVVDAANVLLPVVSAVGTAHAAGIIHRDLKPDNIFLAEEAGQTVVKVLDFGIAKLVSADEQDAVNRTGTGILVGTPGYMAPEQCFGDRDIDHRADIWSLGAILYEVLTGKRALSGDNLGQVIKGALSNGIVPIEKLLPDLPSDISTLIGRMLAGERDDRPADLREAYDVLARYAEVQCPMIPPPMSRQPPPVESGPMHPGPAPLAFARTEQAGAELARRSR